MKKLLFFLIAVVFMWNVPLIGHAQITENIRLTWEHGNEADLAGFYLYQGDINTAGCPDSAYMVVDLEYNGEENSFTTEYQVTGESGEIVYFKVTAYDLAGNESACSNVASYTLPDIIGPSAPFNLTIEVVVVPPSP